MNNEEQLEIWKRKLVEIEDKIRKLNNEKTVLINLLNEIKTRQNIKLNNLLIDSELEEEISHLNNWAEFYEQKIPGLKNKIETLKEEISKQEFEKIKEDVKLGELLEEKEEITIEETPEVKIDEKQPIKEEIKIEIEEKSDEEILEQKLEELDKESKELAEKETEQKEEAEELKLDIPSPEELEKELEEERLKEKVEEIVEKEPEIKAEKEQVKVEEKQPVRVEDLAAIIKLFDKKEKKPEFKVEEKEIRKQIKELFAGKEKIKKPIRIKEKLRLIKEPIDNIFEKVREFDRQKLVRYAVPVVIVLLIASVLFISKPGITGYVTLKLEKTYDDTLSLIVNESGNYTWTLDKAGDTEAIKASGKVKGNGTVRIYIEKDGERYLIYDNKAND